MIALGNRWIRVSVAWQELELYEGDAVVWTAPVSTAAAGLGEEEGSFRTPRGRHAVAEKIGAGAVPGTVFRSRKDTGEIWTPENGVGEADLILSRILWLEGLEERNRTSKERYIYIHGTNHETQLGTSCSKGCIRMGNGAVIELFDLVEIGTIVEIVEN